ncbi:DUF2180 family protein [Streptomyces mirabilis]|uniref:DUF2180 family protein n=1 Tax=Streptomyces mirabilis TaxID=68239 RepID=UPI00368A6A07
MNCYDCHDQERPATVAVALCIRCGAALCTAHSQTRPVPVHRVRGMGLATSPHLARRITCTVCHKAEAGS